MLLTDVLVAAAIVVGLVGIVVPVLPGSLLILGAVLVWAVAVGSTAGWIVFVVSTGLLAAGTVLKYAVPGRRLSSAGVPRSTLVIGGLVGIAGFFVVPVVGLLLGFVLGVYAAEHRRDGPQQAWPSTKAALHAVGLSMLLELGAGLLAAVAWAAGATLV